LARKTLAPSNTCSEEDGTSSRHIAIPAFGTFTDESMADGYLAGRSRRRLSGLWSSPRSGAFSFKQGTGLARSLTGQDSHVFTECRCQLLLHASMLGKRSFESQSTRSRERSSTLCSLHEYSGINWQLRGKMNSPNNISQEHSCRCCIVRLRDSMIE
jgi:hypothetical protein